MKSKFKKLTIYAHSGFHFDYYALRTMSKYSNYNMINLERKYCFDKKFFFKCEKWSLDHLIIKY